MVKPDGVQRAFGRRDFKKDWKNRLENRGLWKWLWRKKSNAGSITIKMTPGFCQRRKDRYWKKSERNAGWKKKAIEYGKDIIGQLGFFHDLRTDSIYGHRGQSGSRYRQEIGRRDRAVTSDVGTIRGDLTLDSYALAGIDAERSGILSIALISRKKRKEKSYLGGQERDNQL